MPALRPCAVVAKKETHLVYVLLQLLHRQQLHMPDHAYSLPFLAPLLPHWFGKGTCSDDAVLTAGIELFARKERGGAAVVKEQTGYSHVAKPMDF